MSTACRDLIVQQIRHRGPITVADFMDLALYHPQVGYYATAGRRSGRHGDFYTSVDVGPVFGELLAEQFLEMARLPAGLRPRSTPDERRRVTPDRPDRVAQDHRDGLEQGFSPGSPIDLVEAGAGDGRLARDVLDGLERLAPDVYARVGLHLVERSVRAREAHSTTLGPHAPKLATSSPDLPSTIHGIVFANELLDALPTHAVVCRDDGLREIFIDAVGHRLVEREMPLSTPAIGAYFTALDIRLLPGWRAEVNLRAVEWMQRVARALRHGFLVLIDYGHRAPQLYSSSHASGTLATFTGHVVETYEDGRTPSWLRDPGDSDITAHVDFTSIQNAAAQEGLSTLCRVDQLHFLLGLGVERHLRDSAGSTREAIGRRLALKTLLVPGGLGTTHQVMILGRNTGRPQLRGCSASR